MALSQRTFSFFVDRGGTFTDVVASVDCGDGAPRVRVLKLLSVDPAYKDAPTEGIRRLLEQETGVAHPRGVPVDTARIVEIRMGTTVATNALLERKGERCALAVTAGFRDLLHIGNQSRPRIFDLDIVCPDVLYDTVVEVDELVSLPLGTTSSARDGPLSEPHMRPELDGTRATGTTGEAVIVRKALDLDACRRDLVAVRAKGITSLAVCFKHAALYPAHEHAVGDLARSLGFTHVSLSSVVLPAVKMVPRGYTAAADAYLTPHIQRYLADFTAGFDAGLANGAVRLSFMQSDGGLARASAFSGHRAILSGPAGGVVGFARTTRWEGEGGDPENMQAVGFDMGGTSTDVSRVAHGVMEHVFETTTAGITVAAPQLDVNTVAAGGGSKLMFVNGAFAVGPDSVGAHPGPVCYRKGGSLAVTDANLQLGRIVPTFFPHIFGPQENQPLDSVATAAAFQRMADQVNAHQRVMGGDSATILSPDDVAAGFVRVANEAMCRPIRALTNMKGYDPAAHVLACFGGAGGQHACAIARALGMRTVFVHRFASVLSALGIGLAATVHEVREPAAGSLAPGPAGGDVFEPRFRDLEAAARDGLVRQGFAQSDVACERFLNLRYEGTDVAIMTPQPQESDKEGISLGDYAAAFVARYKREFGFTLDRPLIVDDLRVRATAAGTASPDDGPGSGATSTQTALPAPSAQVSAFFDATGRVDTPVYHLRTLHTGAVVPGPALLVDDISTVVIEPACVANITASGNIRIDVCIVASGSADNGDGANSDDSPPDPIQLSIFGHRFMGIAEQMGRTLQRTSVSVNIKERLDFSCALFGPDGGLVANAPHLPVHLGAMQEAVRFQLLHHSRPGADPLIDGDVLVSNHPQLAGGSHLPDITVITPVFDASGPDGQLVFFVASRGHHADIGGISPGSMPPHSTCLAQEGAAIVSHKLVRQGVFDEAGISELLMAPAASGVSGCSGTRNLRDNLSDLRAQVAANQRGIALVRELIAEHGLRTVKAYMMHIRNAAERAVRAMLVRFSHAQGLPDVGTVRAVDYLDDGTPIALAVTIDRTTGSAIFDFTGTGQQVHGNLNAPPAVTYSAVIYALRCMVREDIPLNQGCLAPITCILPDECVLKPCAIAAVVGGNVLTSQRVTDVVLKAFAAAAASQGCMNNLTFGDSGLGYYETIAGGAGAGPGFHGRSGVHTHMTNTRITDPEILERRFPVVLRAFTLRQGSGGAGRWRGGDGVIRELEVLRPLTVGILSERRSLPPFGLQGGADAQRGLNLWLQARLTTPQGRIPVDGIECSVSLGAKATVLMQPGDRLRVLTPGGGGFGDQTSGDGEDGPGLLQGRAPSGTALREGGSVDAYRRAQESV